MILILIEMNFKKFVLQLTTLLLSYAQNQLLAVLLASHCANFDNAKSDGLISNWCARTRGHQSCICYRS